MTDIEAVVANMRNKVMTWPQTSLDAGEFALGKKVCMFSKTQKKGEEQGQRVGGQGNFLWQHAMAACWQLGGVGKCCQRACSQISTHVRSKVVDLVHGLVFGVWVPSNQGSSCPCFPMRDETQIGMYDRCSHFICLWLVCVCVCVCVWGVGGGGGGGGSFWQLRVRQMRDESSGKG